MIIGTCYDFSAHPDYACRLGVVLQRSRDREALILFDDLSESWVSERSICQYCKRAHRFRGDEAAIRREFTAIVGHCNARIQELVEREIAPTRAVDTNEPRTRVIELA